MSMPITPYVWELEGDIYKWMNLNFLHFLDESSSLQSLLHSRPPNYSLERNDSSRLEIVLPSITSLEVGPSMHSNLDTISREILEASKGISRSLRENETRGWLQAPLFSKELTYQFVGLWLCLNWEVMHSLPEVSDKVKIELDNPNIIHSCILIEIGISTPWVHRGWPNSALPCNGWLYWLPTYCHPLYMSPPIISRLLLSPWNIPNRNFLIFETLYMNFLK